MGGRVEIHKDSGGIYFRLVAKDGQTPLLESRRYRTLCPVEDAIQRLEGVIDNPKRWMLSDEMKGVKRLVGKGATGVEFVASVKGRLGRSANAAEVRKFLGQCASALEKAPHVDVRPKRSRAKDNSGNCAL